jgi:transposase
MSRANKPPVVEVDAAAVQALMGRAKQKLSAEDYAMLQGLVETLLYVVELVRKGRATIARLRRLVGLDSTEKMAEVLRRLDEAQPTTAPSSQTPTAPDAESASQNVELSPSPAGADAAAKGNGADGSKPKGHGRLSVSDYPDATHVPVRHESLRAGDRCPSCGRGTLFPLQQPARLLRIVGQAPLVAVCWDCERLRCSGCGLVHTATAPCEAQGVKYSETAAAMIALQRYGLGVPFHRLEQLQRQLGAPVPASTQWDVVHARVEEVYPAYQELVRRAAQGSVVHNDDTYNRILQFMGKRRAALLRHGGLPDPERTGLFTTGIVAVTERRTIALFFTGRKHAGENLAAVLDHRPPGLGPPTLICDALARNLPPEHQVVEGNCGSHARRHFVDQVENFPSECRHVLESLGKLFQTEETCRTEGLTEEQRLRRHQEQSGPVMDELKLWMEAQFSDKRVEPNSGLGDAMNYMLKRWDKFTLFLRVPGAPLHNNIVERALKKATRHRNNSIFYRSQRGATVGDVYMSLIHTTELDGGDAFHYLTELMRHPKAVADNPGDWLPWSYRQTLARKAAASLA